MSKFDPGARPVQPRPGHQCVPDTPDARVRLAAMTTMAATLAHEVSQPLAAATNSIQACARHFRTQSGDREDLLPMIEHAGRETAKAGEIVRRMRSFIVNGKISGRRRSLAAMIDAAGSALPFPDRGRVELVMAIQPDAGHVVADRVQIEQVFSIILKNACEALAGRTIRRVTIEAARFGDQVAMRIQDSGPGLSPEAFAHLFEPLFTTKPGGTGLGLAICKAIVEAHGGRFWAEPPGSGGAVFGLSLPAAE